MKASGTPPGGPRLDRVVHEPVRLRVLVHLASSEGGVVGFVALREALGLSAGNLSVQLRTLAEAGLVAMDKGYRDNRPATDRAPHGATAVGRSRRTSTRWTG